MAGFSPRRDLCWNNEGGDHFRSQEIQSGSDTLQAFRSGCGGKPLISARKTEVENAGIFHREGGCELEGTGGLQWVGTEKAKRQFANGGGRVHLVPCGGEFREAFAGKLSIGGIQ